jgi:hypothetical protein
MTYHIFDITAAGEINPEVWVSAQTFPYSKDARLLSVRIREKNPGKVRIELEPNALSLTVKKIPDGLKPGYVDIDEQPAVLKQNALFERYGEGVELEPGVEFEDVAEFVIEPGLYHIEATLALPECETVNSIAVHRVE